MAIIRTYIPGLGGADCNSSYPMFFAELESAEALASSQQKYQTLNLAE